ncbi:MAG: fucose isomerase, partial [Firmicutes bacterium]|nr:fucose isomerase [Bacillota bacterium]
VGTALTGEAAFFGDPVALCEEENSLTFWHCGMASCSLAREDTGACVGVHPNRKIGPTMEFGAKAAAEVTILRIGKDRDGSFRLFAAAASSLDKPRQYLGTSMVVQPKIPVRNLVDQLLADGFEPHYAITYGDITEELNLLAGMLQIPFVEYKA